MGGRGGGGPRALDAVTFMPFGPSSRTVNRPTISLPADSVEGRIVLAYMQIQGPQEPGNYDFSDLTSLVRLRAAQALKGLTREQVDRGLRSLNDKRYIILAEEENRKALPAIGRRDGIVIGGTERHLISIGRR